MIPLALACFYGFTLSSPFALGKLLAVSLCGLWLALGRTYRIGVLPLAYVCVAVLTTLTSADLWQSYWGLWGTYTCGLLCALVLIPFWCCVGPGDRAGLEAGLGLSVVVLAAVAVLQLLGYILPYELPEGPRAYSLLGSPIYVGAFCALAVPFCRGWQNVALVVLLWSCGSRGAWLACGVGMLYQYWPRISPRLRYWGMVSLLLGLCFAFWLRPLSDLGRLVVWSAAWDAFKARPWLGWGLGNFYMVAELYRNPLWVEAYGNTTQDHAHNLILEAMACGGVVGLVGLAVLLYALWKPSTRPVRAALLGVFVVGLLNPLPLVVKALAIALAASCAVGKDLEPLPNQNYVKSFFAPLIIFTFLLLSADRIITLYGQDAWSFSSRSAAYMLGILRDKVEPRKFKL